ncbi:MAG: DUF6478 family protein [Pseudomonadota bacterium]
MKRRPEPPGGDLAIRALSAFWRRRAQRSADPARALARIEGLRDALDQAAKAARRRRAPLAARDQAEAHELWRVAPEVFEGAADIASANPPSGLAVDPQLSVYHDAEGWADGAPAGPLALAPSLFALTTRPARRGGRRALFFESYEFRGEYLSLVLSVPDGLSRPAAGERLRLALDVVATRPIRLFARLNHEGPGGAGVAQLEAEAGEGPVAFDFDPAVFSPPIGPRDRIWVEALFDRPRMIEIEISRLSFSLTKAGAA